MNPHSLPDHLHEHFAWRANRDRESIALVEGTRQVTYQELRDSVDRLSSNLAAEGIRAGSAVGLHMERSIDWILSILAILKLNAAVVPLPPSYPPDRLSEIIHYARLDGILGRHTTTPSPSARGRIFDLEEMLDGTPHQPVLEAGNPDQAAFILSSSGSTGHPKMIVRSHRSFFHRLRWTWNLHPYGPEERCCQKSHMTTTHAIYELFEPLLQGVPVVIVSDEEVRDLEGFWEILRSQGITRLLIVPSQLQASLALPGFTPPPIRVLVLMGEYVSSGLVEQALEAFSPPARLYSIYGSTEASSTLVCDLREDYRPGRELPLGKPIQPEVKARVLDPAGSTVEPGQTGRLFMSGPSLFRGYFRDDERSASVLKAMPPADTLFYDTGDEVRLTPNGDLEYVGRADHTIKVRGFRVDLQEVERTLLMHPEVRQAAVVARKDGSGTHRLLAFVTPSGLDSRGIYQTLRSRLPDYMVPSQVAGLEAFPLTASGKIDRQSLHEPEQGPPDRSFSDRELSGTEEQVALAWQQLLHCSDFPPHASFFEVGGTSLSVLSLVNLLREAFSLSRQDLGVQAVYQWPTIESLAGHIEALQAGTADGERPKDPILVTLRSGKSARLSPLFLIASAGGALGSYEKLSRALSTDREIIGVRDPFLWGGRDPLEGFSHWVDQYLNAIRERQPSGPYYIGAYSSAGAFGYEIARRLQGMGEEVGLLALVDPLGMDRRSRWRFGWWVLRSTYGRPHIRWLTRLAGWLLPPAVLRSRFFASRARPESPLTSPEDTVELGSRALQNRQQVINFSALLELNTGMPYTLDSSDLQGEPPEKWFEVLLERVASLTPDADPQDIERIFLQYPMQTRAQNVYEPKPYDGKVFLVEPSTPYGGLIRAQLKPYVRNLEVQTLRLGEPGPRIQAVCERLGALGTHYRSMRDEGFVRALAGELDARLG